MKENLSVVLFYTRIEKGGTLSKHYPNILLLEVQQGFTSTGQMPINVT